MAKKSKGPKWYAVAVGRAPGIYRTWAECEKQTKGYSGAVFKSFKTPHEANVFIQANSSSSRSSSASAASSSAASSSSANNNDRKRARDDAASAQLRKKKYNQSYASTSSNARVQNEITIHFDGGARGNPGVAGAGAEVVVTKYSSGSSSKTTTYKYQIREYCGDRQTNNYAEYKGLLAGLKQAKSHLDMSYNLGQPYVASVNSPPLFRLRIFGDSNLIIQQLRGAWQCKNANIRPLYKQSVMMIVEMKKLDPRSEVEYDHVYRDQNKVADALANEAMNTRRSWTTASNSDTAGDSSEDDEKPPAVAASNSYNKGKSNRPAVAKQEVIDVDDSDDGSHHSC